jgi:hypothetical protein
MVCFSIGSQYLRDIESMYNILTNKLNYLCMCHILQRNNPSLFTEVIRSNQDKAVSI